MCREICSVFAAVFASVLVPFVLLCSSAPANAQIYPPGQFAIDGYPVVCGGLPTVVTANFPDAGMNNGQAIFLNPLVFARLPTVLKLYIYAHECGHSVVGHDEMGADCWAIRTGRDQGWFPPQAFAWLMQFFNGNMGSLRHPPGAVRVQAMFQCYHS